MIDRNGTRRGEVLVGLRGEVVPDISADCIGGEWTAGIGSQEGNGNALVCGEIVIGEKVRLMHDGSHFGFEVVGLRPVPVVVPAGHVVPAGAAGRVEALCRLRDLAGVAASATF